MQANQDVSTLSDDELLRRLAALLASSRQNEAALVAHIGEVDARRLYARLATPSMFVYCTERLQMSEAEACLRIAAARASREHPVILGMLADGRLHLSAVAKLAPHLTAQNRDELLRRATHRTKREIDDLVAELSPRPDVPAVIRKLPAGRLVTRPVSQRLDLGAAIVQPKVEVRPERVDSDGLEVVSGLVFGLAAGVEHVPECQPAPMPRRERPLESASLPGGVSGGQPRSGSGARCPHTASYSQARSDIGLAWVAALPRPAVVEPLAPARFKVQFTASAELREKLERLQALVRSSIPDGDLAAVIEVAVTEKLERLEARRFGRTMAPRKSVSTSDAAARTRRIPAAVRRAVCERDEGRCCYVDAQGHRCTASARLGFHHRRPWAIGGDHSPDNLALLCLAHNRLMAEIDYGRGAIEKHRTLGRGRRRRATEVGIG